MSDPGINEENGDAGETGEEKALLEPEKTVEPPPSIQQLLLLNEKLQQDQAPVGELAEIMRLNVEKILQRYPNYSELDQRADRLKEDESQSQQQAVKNQEQCLMKFIEAGAIISIILLIIIFIVVLGRHFDFMFSNSNTTYQGASSVHSLAGPRYSDKINGG